MRSALKVFSILSLALLVSTEAFPRGGGGRGGSGDHGRLEDRGRGRGSDDYGGEHGRGRGRGRGRHSHDGFVTVLPSGGFGLWVVGERRIRVDRHTIIHDEDGLLGRGGFVEIWGTERDGILEAEEIEVRRSR